MQFNGCNKEGVDIEGFEALKEVFKKYSDNLKGITFEPEEEQMMGVNPHAFRLTADVEDITRSNSKTAEMLTELFEANPKAKVIRITVEPRVGLKQDFTPKLKGGTITISGSF